MAAIPTYVTSGVLGSSATNFNVALPAGMVDGDYMILQTETSGTAITTPTNWTHMATLQQATTVAVVRQQIFGKRWVSGDSDPTVTAITDHVGGQVHGFRQTDTKGTGNPVDGQNSSQENAADTSLSYAPGIASDINNCLIAWFIAVETDIGTARWGTFTNAALASVTKQQDGAHTTGDGGGLALVTGTIATAGSIGTLAATANTSTRKAYAVIMFSPEADYTSFDYSGWFH